MPNELLHMDRQTLRRLLAQVGSMATGFPESPSAEPMDWNQCRTLSSAVLETWKERFSECLEQAAERMSRRCSVPWSVASLELTQHYAASLIEAVRTRGTADYALRIDEPERRAVGLLLIEQNTARVWANAALGTEPSSEEDDSEAEALLSALEETFLVDVARDWVEPILPQWERDDLAIGPELVNGPVRAGWQGTEPLAELAFSAGPTESEDRYAARLLFPCSWLREPGADEDVTDDVDAAELIKASLQNYPVEVDVFLGDVEMTFEEIASLQAQDILVLDRRVGDPVEVWVAGRRAFRGQPAQVQGRRAVRIVE